MSLRFRRSAVQWLVLLSVGSVLGACQQQPDAVPSPQPDAQPPTAPQVPAEEAAVRHRGVPLIFDSDLGYDADDAGALAVLHKLADRREVQLLATMSVVGDPQSAAALDVINTYYGRPDTPVGALQSDRWDDARGYWYEEPTDFLAPLVRRYPSSIKDKTDAQEAVALYRKTLAAQPDKSVTIVAVGFALNLTDLLASAGDSVSPLSGEALVAQKVEQLVYMGSTARGERPDFNLGDGPFQDGSTAQRLLEHWPTPIVFVSAEVGNTVKTGSSLRDQLPENPVATAYDLYPGVDAAGQRPSWDLTAVLYAVRGGSAFWQLETDKHLVVEGDGTTHWAAGATEPARDYLGPSGSASDLEDVLEGLLATPPAESGAPF